MEEKLNQTGADPTQKGTDAEQTEKVQTKVKKQCLENLPAELLTQPRFFPVGRMETKNGKKVFNQKLPPTGWNESKNQKLYTQVHYTDNRQMAGYDIVGHDDKAPSYIVLDFDHVLNKDTGEFKTAEIEDWFNAASHQTYCEKSLSGEGFHVILRPNNKEDFAAMASWQDHCLYFIDGDTETKVEIFYNPNGRYFLLTGDCTEYCAPQTPISTDCSIVKDILSEIAGKKILQAQKAESNNFVVPSNNKELALETLKYIPCDSYDTWYKVGMALYQNGNSCEDWDAWSKTDKREGQYIIGACEKKWKSFGKAVNTPLTLRTLIFWARQNGFQYISTGTNAADDFVRADVEDAVHLLQSFSADNLTREIIRDKKTLRAAALCNLFDNQTVTDDFVNLAVNLKFPNVNNRNLTRDINKQEKIIKEEEKQRLKNKAKKLREKEKTAKNNAINRIELLKNQPQTPERDTEIIKLINDACDWEHNLFGEKTRIKANAHNANLIFSCDPMINGLFGYDDFLDATVFLKNPSWNDTAKNELWTDTDSSLLRCYLRENYNDFSSPSLIEDYITKYAQGNRFNQIKKYLESLHWDGTTRAEKIFVDSLGVDDTDYSREITFKVLLAAVARTYHNGLDFQICPVLKGAQGIGKSHILRRLGGKWHMELIDSADSRQAIDALKSAWVCEIAEFSAFKKSEINALKSFISRSTDVYRAAYERREKVFKRKCVFIATTNDNAFLTDTSGNRRFAILECKNRFNEYREGLLTDAYIDNVWAEIKYYYDKNLAHLPVKEIEQRLQLSRQTRELAETTAEKFVSDDLTEEIQSFLAKKIPPKNIWRLCTKEERRKFYECGHLFLPEDEFHARMEALPKKFQITRDSVDAEFQEAGLVEEPLTSTSIKPRYGAFFYGTELRQHISPSEIYNECFSKGDRRRNFAKIASVLDKLSDWTQGQRLQNSDPQYVDKKRVYYRTTCAENISPNAADDSENVTTQINDTEFSTGDNSIKNIDAEKITTENKDDSEMSRDEWLEYHDRQDYPLDNYREDDYFYEDEDEDHEEEDFHEGGGFTGSSDGEMEI